MLAVKCLVFCCFICRLCSAYNVDIKTTNARLWEGPTGSYFGFSLALHGRTMKENIVLVGAPLNDSVYICPDNSTDNKCEAEILKDSNPSEEADKIKQWFGASIFTAGKHKPVVVCAPRHTITKKTNGGDRVYHLAGKCVWFNSSLKNNKTISPCYSSRKSCQVGIDISYYHDSKTILFGAAGSNGGAGALIIQDNAPESKTFAITKDNKYIPDKTFNNDYLGYSVTNGNFYTNNTDEQELAGGQPRRKITGMVLIYKYEGGKNLKWKQTIAPPEVGDDRNKFMYFGASVCAVDINNDGYSDLLVGAPFYCDKGDEGRVYVYLSQENSAGKRILKLAPSGEHDADVDPGLGGSDQKGARFGWTIARAGDLNNDGYQDVIIGAPHDGPDLDGDGVGNGAIYIYHGLASGDMKKYKQKITAEDMKSRFSVNFKQFGYAVSRSVVTDDNEYPDIAVGSWQSDNVVLLRTRPIMVIDASLSLSKREIPVDNIAVNCMDGSTKRQCLNATVCFKYLGKSIQGSQVLDYIFTLDNYTTAATHRVYLTNKQGKKTHVSQGSIVLVQKDKRFCQNFNNIFMEDSTVLRNSLTRGNSIQFKVEYKLKSIPGCDTTKLCPMLDPSQEPVIEEKATLILNCSGNMCDYDLFVKLSANRNITIGFTRKVIVEVILGNKNETSYNPEIIINHHPSLQYENIIFDEKNVRIERQTLRSEIALKSEKFILQGAVESGKQVVFRLQYSTSKVRGNQRELTIDVETKGISGHESNNANNKDSISFRLHREVKLSIVTTYVPKALTYSKSPLVGYPSGNRTDFSNVLSPLVGELVKATFVLTNVGKSPLQSIKFMINFPFREKGENNQQKYIVYPVDIKYPRDNGNCEKPKFNPEAIEHVAYKLVLRSRSKRAVIDLNSQNKENKTIECKVNELESTKRFRVEFWFRVWVNTLIKYHPNDLLLKISANAIYQDSLDGKRNHSTENTLMITVTAANPAAKKKKIHTWIIIVAILCGILLLALAVFVLFKCGFFKRNRPPKHVLLPQNDDAAVVAL